MSSARKMARPYDYPAVGPQSANQPVLRSPLNLSAGTAADQEGLEKRIRELAPWHMAIQITSELSTADPVSGGGEILDPAANLGITLQAPRTNFLDRIDSIYPHGLGGKKMIDCGCNAGGFSFWATERNVEYAFGFDAREHWIRQARFVKAQRVVADTGATHFARFDISDLPKWKLPVFDFSLFRGLFSHVADPVAALRNVANLTRETILVNTQFLAGNDDGTMKMSTENSQRLMAGVDGIKWLPSGPRVISDILEWLGFHERVLIFRNPPKTGGRLGRLEIVAARKKNTLANVEGVRL